MPTTTQNLMLGEELLTSIRLLKTGLRELNRMDGSTDFFHLPILLLASGFERMMKTIVCCHCLKESGSFPRRSTFTRSRRGHDLVNLLDRVTRECFSDNYLSRIPAARSDISFLRDDTKLNALVQILSDFGQSARYYNLNIVLNELNPGPSPEEEWQKLESEVLENIPLWFELISDPKQYDSVHERINQVLTIQLERFARALSRLFTIGGLGSYAKQISGCTHHFLFLMDDQLGQTNYNEIRI